MSDIDIALDQLGKYPATLTGVAGRTRELAAQATAFASTTGREDSATAAAGLAEHLDFWLDTPTPFSLGVSTVCPSRARARR